MTAGDGGFSVGIDVAAFDARCANGRAVRESRPVDALGRAEPVGAAARPSGAEVP
jgi:hypothetical protein